MNEVDYLCKHCLDVEANNLEVFETLYLDDSSVRVDEEKTVRTRLQH